MAKSTKSAKGKSQTKDSVAEEEQSDLSEKQVLDQPQEEEKPNTVATGDVTEADATDETKQEPSDTSDADQAPVSAQGKSEENNKASPDAVSSEESATGLVIEDEESAAPVADTGPLVEEVTAPTRGSALPLILGGVIAAVIGYGAAQVLPGLKGSDDSADLTQILDSQSQDIAAMRAEIEMLRAAPAPAFDHSADLDALGTQIAELAERLTDLENRPLASGDGSELTIALQSHVAELQNQIEDLANSGATQLDSARQALLRAAITRIAAAIDSGEGFAAALGEITDNSDLTVPDALRNVASTGVATEAQLRQAFAPAARAAIGAETQARIDSGELSRVSGFLQQQLGMRSLSPREGDDADAILSRAEDALKRGDLAASLTEMTTLPETAAPAMQEWVASAEKRLAALSGLSALTDALNSN